MTKLSIAAKAAIGIGISLPVIVGIYLVIKYLKPVAIPAKTAIPNTNGVLPKTNKSTGGTGAGTASSKMTSATAATSGCTFPLQVGSNNPCVGQLQDALGVTIDNDFGSQTLAALTDQTGLTAINSSDILNSTIDSIVSNDNNSVTTNTSAANAIIFSMTSQSFAYTNLQSTTNSVWNQVQQSGSDWVSAGYQISMPTGAKMSLTDYAPQSVDSSNGNLIVYCGTGGNMGYWSVDPTTVSLV